LEEREWILGNLYQLFAKELLLVVLDENIPQLNSIVNAYLTNVVDYTLDMHVVQWSNLTWTGSAKDKSDRGTNLTCSKNSLWQVSRSADELRRVRKTDEKLKFD
jgi:hypothetical protein